jgi:hypothetical protein
MIDSSSCETTKTFAKCSASEPCAQHSATESCVQYCAGCQTRFEDIRMLLGVLEICIALPLSTIGI